MSDQQPPEDLHLPGPMDPVAAMEQASRDTARLEREQGIRTGEPHPGYPGHLDGVGTLPAAFEGVFDFHPADEERARLHTLVRAACKDLAVQLAGLCPPSAETTLALRQVQGAMHQANAAIAVHHRPSS